MKTGLLILILSLLAGNSFAQTTTISPSSTRVGSTEVFSASFDSRKELRKNWDKRPARRWTSIDKDSLGNYVLKVVARNADNRLLEKNLPIGLVTGRKLLIRLRLRSTDINRPVSYKGVKVALHISSPTGEAYPQLSMPSSDQPWQNAGFTAIIPQNATSCTLLLGLEGATGTAFFDDLSVSVFPKSSDSALRNAASESSTILRGMMVSTWVSAEDLRTLASWGANHVRWQLTWNGFPDTPADTASLGTYRQWLTSALAHVHALMPLCDSLGLKVILDLHTLPGGRERDLAGQEHRIFRDKITQSSFREIWKDIAQRFRDQPALLGYDLANEPIEGYLPDSLLDWQSLAAATAADIYAIDSKHNIIIEGAPNGAPEAITGLAPLPGFDVLHSFHMYEPTLFTHQGIYGLDTGIKYPGIVAGKFWNKDTIQHYLQPIRDWQLRNGTRVYVGEFSAVRWAPDSSAYNYLRDCIDIFEQWGWSWAYHAFREWDGWSVEHDANPNHHDRTSQPTERQLLLMESFQKNKTGH